MIRMGFVGAGFMGQLAHIANYARLDTCECTALAEGRRELAKRVAKKYGIKRVYAHHRELLEDDEIDAVAAILPYTQNYGVVKDLLTAGKHVITEKPMAYWPEEGEELVRLAAEKDLVYQVGYMKRHDPGVVLGKTLLQELLSTRACGELRFIRVWCSGGDWLQGIEPPIQTNEPCPAYGAPRMDAPDWFDERAHSRYDFLLNISSHVTNLLRYLTEQDFTLTGLNDYPGAPAFAFFVRLTDGTPGVFEHACRSSHCWEEGATFTFSEAQLTIESASPMNRQQTAIVKFQHRDGHSWRDDLIRPELRWAFAEQARHFVASVDGEESPKSPAAEAIKELFFARDYVRKLLED